MSRKRKSRQRRVDRVASGAAEPQAIVIHPGLDGVVAPVPTDDVRVSEALDPAAGATPLAAEPVLVGIEEEAPSAVAPPFPAELAPPEPQPVREAPPEAHSGAGRLHSLDALRGAFLLIMTIAMTIPERIYPAWMYHRQTPPPTHAFAPLAGLTWVDVPLVAFIFCMAAALPISAGRQVDAGRPAASVLFASLQRGAMLFIFALLIGHSNTYWMGTASLTTNLVGLGGFALMFLVFTRRKSSWDERTFSRVRLASWIALAAFFAVTPLLYGKTFSLYRTDDIILQIAFASVTGVAIWYFTRDNLLARMAVLGGATALVLGSMDEGWIQQWWDSSPAPWLFKYDYIRLLFVVVPGTIAGDLLVQWRKSADRGAVAWSRQRLAFTAALAMLFAPLLVIGLYHHRNAGVTAQIAMGLIAAGMVLVHAPQSSGERMVRKLFAWGSFWTVLGLWMEPFEGGIKKDPGTIAYYLTISGISIFMLLSLAIVVDLLHRRRWLSAAVDVGQNPMICYVMYIVFLSAVMALIPGLDGVFAQSIPLSLARTAAILLAVTWITREFTRRGIFWRT